MKTTIHHRATKIKPIEVKDKAYFLKPYEPFGGDNNVKVDLSNYARNLFI